MGTEDLVPNPAVWRSNFNIRGHGKDGFLVVSFAFVSVVVAPFRCLVPLSVASFLRPRLRPRRRPTQLTKSYCMTTQLSNIAGGGPSIQRLIFNANYSSINSRLYLSMIRRERSLRFLQSTDAIPSITMNFSSVQSNASRSCTKRADPTWRLLQSDQS